jgi:hypothetical protein
VSHPTCRFQGDRRVPRKPYLFMRYDHCIVVWPLSDSRPGRAGLPVFIRYRHAIHVSYGAWWQMPPVYWALMVRATRRRRRIVSVPA